MTDKEKIITNLQKALNSLDVTSDLRLVLIQTIEYLQEKPVSIWHDVNQPPEINTTILVRTYDNIVESTKRYDDNLIPWEDRIKRDDITHWCYVEDLLNL